MRTIPFTKLATRGLLAFSIGTASALAAAAPASQPPKPPATLKIVLAGDSTVTDSAGWGKGFARLLKPGARCVNLAVGGRSSKSYRAEGLWRKVLAQKPDYVLIQFGHNDVPGKGPKRETDPKTTFRENLARYVDEARAAGIKPVLVTSMTHRNFGPDDQIHDSLGAYVEATRKVAADKKAPLIDLHARSIELLNKLGPKESLAFDPPPRKPRQPASAPAETPAPDKCHLSRKGADAMAKLVADELKKAAPELAPYLP
jgi:lysophospholipase L1-like esterase